MKQRIPKGLIYARCAMGFVILILSALEITNYRYYAVALLTIGLLTDIFDGIIARRIGVSSEALRRLDSGVDQWFFCAMALATYFQCPDFFKSNRTVLFVLLGTEGLTYIFSFWKFKKEVATHTIGAKIWALFLFASLVDIILRCQSNFLFQCCFWLGILSRLEIIAILSVLKVWTNDVPTLFHALKLRQGKVIKRHKWFNG